MNATDASADTKNTPLPASIARSTRGPTGPGPGKATATRRRRDKQEGARAGLEERYFLADGDGKSDVPSLGREFGSEAEAIIEAFRAKANFFRITEFQTRADIGKAGEPILKKEALKKNTPAS
jgi:hypothetical protein